MPPRQEATNRLVDMAVRRPVGRKTSRTFRIDNLSAGIASPLLVH